MRILNRPMFRYGGPIKEGVMHGMKNGGLSKQFNTGLVGDERYPKTGGREHHWAFLPAAGAAALRFLPNIYRGIKAGKYVKGWRPTAQFRQPSVPTNQVISGKYNPAPLTKKEMFTSPEIWGKAIRENPWTAFTAASIAPQAGALGYKGAKAGIKALPGALKRYADMVVPGDQSRWWKDKEPPTGVPLNPNLQQLKTTKKTQKKKFVSAAELAAEAKAERTKRLNKYLETMGYDKAKKTALSDALIDASAIVQGGTAEAGSLKKADWSKMINQAIQTTSKRLDKPEQIREAVGLMMAKGDIEKELYDARPGTHLKNAQDMAETLGISVEEAMNRVTGQATTIGDSLQALQILKKGGTLSSKEIEQRLRNFANKNDLDLKQVVSTDQLDKLKEDSGDETIDSMTIVTGLLTGDAEADDGLYQIGTEVVLVEDGVPKREW